MPSAIVVRARLPSPLERIRRDSIANSAIGVPAHLTMLYPFIEPPGLDRHVRRAIESVARRHAAFDYRLLEVRRWADTVYVAVDPEAPFIRLQADLAGAFPDHPIYGRSHDFEYVPHISIAEGSGMATAVDRVPRDTVGLPAWARATTLEVIATGPGGRWETVWRIRLG